MVIWVYKGNNRRIAKRGEKPGGCPAPQLGSGLAQPWHLRALSVLLSMGCPSTPLNLPHFPASNAFPYFEGVKTQLFGKSLKAHKAGEELKLLQPFKGLISAR